MIVHIVSQSVWNEAQAAGEYRGDTLETEGFIHCSTPEQVVEVANRRFKGRMDLSLLVIDPNEVKAQILFEDGGNGELYPHIYGPLNLFAVKTVVPFPSLGDGTFVLPKGVLEKVL